MSERARIYRKKAKTPDNSNPSLKPKIRGFGEPQNESNWYSTTPAPQKQQNQENISLKRDAFGGNFNILEKCTTFRPQENVQRQEVEEEKEDVEQGEVVQAKCNECEQEEQNQQESELVQTKLTVGEAGNKYEQEADSVAAKVVEQINSPKSEQTVQSKDQMGEISGTIQRDFVFPEKKEKDANKKPVAFEFRIGTELDASFVGLARRLTNDGSISDSELRRLRTHALAQRGTVNDNERMFMAGLLDPANVKTFNAAGKGASFQFPLSSITRTRRNHINNLDRKLPKSVQNKLDDLHEANEKGNFIGPVKEMIEVEKASARAIVSGSGSFRSQAVRLLKFIKTHNISASETLNAMVNAASDNSRGDRVIAGIVYAITRHAGHSLANRIKNGDIKVDALIPRAFADLVATLSASPAGGAKAIYSEHGSKQLKGDTIFIGTDLDPMSTFDRSAVIHELQHAQDDEASSPYSQPTVSAKNKIEAKAYRQQAAYIYKQLASQHETDKTVSAVEVASGINKALLVALVLEGKSDKQEKMKIFKLINHQFHISQQKSDEEIDKFFNEEDHKLEALLLEAINKVHGINNKSKSNTDGLAGESRMDLIERL